MISQAPQFPQDIREGFTDTRMPVGWPKRFVFFGSLVFALIFIIYLGLSFGYQAYLDKQIAGVRSQLDSLSRQVTAEQRDDLATLYSQVANIRTLLGGHTLASGVFDMLQAVTSERVVYTNFELSVPDRKVNLTGIAASYDDLVSQLALFETTDVIESYSLENSEITDSVVRFLATITLKENVLKAQ